MKGPFNVSICAVRFYRQAMMCGRYALYGPTKRGDIPLAGFDEAWSERISPIFSQFQRYNVTPTTLAPIFLQVPGEIESQLIWANWGLRPAWAKQTAKQGFSTINARSETIAEKPAFRGAWRAQRRCLVPVSGWYEWPEPTVSTDPQDFRLGIQSPSERRVVYFEHESQQNPMLLAGIWEPAANDAPLSFSILTQGAVGVVASVHDRQPIVLRWADLPLWLSGELSQISPLLMPAPLPVRFHFVSSRVANVREDDASLIQPIS